MALDSRAKRASALGFGRYGAVSIDPDATKGAGWRASACGNYSGLTFGAPADPFVDLIETMQHTGGAAASQVVLIYGPISLSAGDKLRVQGKFSADDSGSSWLQDKTVISIYRVL